MKSLHRPLVAAALAATLGIGAIAQTQAPAAPPTAAVPVSQQQAQRDPAQRHAHMQKKMERRLGELRQKLAINAAQEGAWNAWTSAVKPGARMQRPDRDEFAKLSTPERIDRMRALHSQRQAEMDKRLDATRTFYAALTAEQKKTFDAESLRFMRGHGRHGAMGHRHG